jgi:hypothetical protein
VKYGRFAASTPISCTGTIPGWSSWLVIRASSRNRTIRRAAADPSCSRSTLIARLRPKVLSRAPKTVPMPPSEIGTGSIAYSEERFGACRNPSIARRAASAAVGSSTPDETASRSAQHIEWSSWSSPAMRGRSALHASKLGASPDATSAK